MSLHSVANVVLLFSDPYWHDGTSVPSEIIRNITALSGDIAYSDEFSGNITTLSTNYVPTSKGLVQGLLYVPDMNSDDPCYTLASQYVPANVTRQANLPNTNYNLIALAPWINKNCTLSYLATARTDNLRSMLVYLPDDTGVRPPSADSGAWDLGDGGAWKEDNHYPVYAVPGAHGREMMRQLSLYSGDLSEVPYAQQINETYHPNPADYVRVWTELSVSSGPASLTYWAFALIIIAVLFAVIGGTSILMHCVQNRRRAALRRRVMNGEVNLEALGIKRLTVPVDHIQTFPLFTYHYDPLLSSPTSPKTPIRTSMDDWTKVRAGRGGRESHPLDYQPTCLICLEEFASRKTIIRELSCGHIFHPECIDEFLGELSSLCPLCKASMLPLGHCPVITNSMVRREAGTRKLRTRSREPHFSDSERGRRMSWKSSITKRFFRTPSPEPDTFLVAQNPTFNRRADATHSTRERMQQLVDPIDDTSSDDWRPRWSFRGSRDLVHVASAIRINVFLLCWHSDIQHWSGVGWEFLSCFG
ncbi:hypothetical protein GGR56DRAFT_541271 [Xylariaceae sp. FL0804]|nr:hypothetical protein GGR56DRAFT_541271 [Xylariaceae sp. FL0804]